MWLDAIGPNRSEKIAKSKIHSRIVYYVYELVVVLLETRRYIQSHTIANCKCIKFKSSAQSATELNRLSSIRTTCVRASTIYVLVSRDKLIYTHSLHVYMPCVFRCIEIEYMIFLCLSVSHLISIKKFKRDRVRSQIHTVVHTRYEYRQRNKSLLLGIILFINFK